MILDNELQTLYDESERVPLMTSSQKALLSSWEVIHSSRTVCRRDIVALESAGCDVSHLPNLNSYTYAPSRVNCEVTLEGLMSGITAVVNGVLQAILAVIRFIGGIFSKIVSLFTGGKSGGGSTKEVAVVTKSTDLSTVAEAVSAQKTRITNYASSLPKEAGAEVMNAYNSELTKLYAKLNESLTKFMGSAQATAIGLEKTGLQASIDFKSTSVEKLISSKQLLEELYDINFANGVSPIIGDLIVNPKSASAFKVYQEINAYLTTRFENVVSACKAAPMTDNLYTDYSPVYMDATPLVKAFAKTHLNGKDGVVAYTQAMLNKLKELTDATNHPVKIDMGRIRSVDESTFKEVAPINIRDKDTKVVMKSANDMEGRFKKVAQAVGKGQPEVVRSNTDIIKQMHLDWMVLQKQVMYVVRFKEHIEQFKRRIDTINRTNNDVHAYINKQLIENHETMVNALLKKYAL